MKKVYWVFLAAALVLALAPHAHAQSADTLRIGTATEGRNYHRLGLGLQRILEENVPDLRIEVLTTDGSVDNVQRLKTEALDLAIVQNDIAFSAERGLDPFAEPVDGLRGVAMLYPEPVFLVTNRADVTRLPQLAGARLSVGPRGSGTEANAQTILKAAGLEGQETEHFRPAEVLGALLQNQVQAAFLNSVSDAMIEEIAQGRLSLISLSNDLTAGLTTTYPYLSAYTAEVAGDPVQTVSVRAMLVARSRISEGVVHRLTEQVHEQRGAVRSHFPSRATLYREADLVSNMPLSAWHDGAFRFYRSEEIIPSNTLFTVLWLSLLIPTLLLGLFGLLNVSLFSFGMKGLRYVRPHSGFLNAIKRVNLQIIRYKYVLLMMVVAAFCFTSVFVIQKVERDWAVQNNTVSQFESRGLSSNALWMFVFAGSGYDDDLFPRSPLGKFFAALIPLFGIGGIVTFVGFLTSDHVKRRIMEARGVKKQSFSDHIILCGWNSNVPFLINNLLHENIVNRRPVLVLADMEEELPLQKFDLDRRMVAFVRGDATKRSDLEKANINNADIAIIASDANSSDPDARNILKTLIIETYCRELEKEGKRKGRDNIYTIAEIRDADNFEAARDAMVDEIVSLGHIKSKIFVHSVLNPGVSSFINEILTYNDFNDIYSHRVKKNGSLTGKKFDDLLVLLRKHKILLLAISVGNARGKAAAEQIKKEHGLERSVLTNPIHEAEISYCTQPGDLLIMLAQYEQTVEKALRKIRTVKA